MSTMNHEYLFFLKSLEKELKAYQSKDPFVETLIREELMDLENAIGKCKQGNYGHCETTGEVLPDAWLENVPTLKSSEDWYHLQSYARISLPLQ